MRVPTPQAKPHLRKPVTTPMPHPAPDPWNFATSTYERDKYAATIAVLPPRHFRRCFEVGCSIGILPRELATRSDTLLGIDISDPALTQARQRCADVDGVAFDRMAIPRHWPRGSFDLIVLSEVLYDLGKDDIRDAAHQTIASLDRTGLLLLVNWHGETGGTCSGDEAASGFIEAAASRLTTLNQHRTEKYRLDLLCHRPPGGSTAA